MATTRFDDFWNQYPQRHSGHRRRAFLVWQAMRCDRHAASILVGLARWKESHRWRCGYICAPVRFLREQFWAIEPPPPPAPVSNDRRVATHMHDEQIRLWLESLNDDNS